MQNLVIVQEGLSTTMRIQLSMTIKDFIIIYI